MPGGLFSFVVFSRLLVSEKVCLWLIYMSRPLSDLCDQWNKPLRQLNLEKPLSARPWISVSIVVDLSMIQYWHST